MHTVIYIEHVASYKVVFLGYQDIEPCSELVLFTCEAV